MSDSGEAMRNQWLGCGVTAFGNSHLILVKFASSGNEFTLRCSEYFVSALRWC